MESVSEAAADAARTKQYNSHGCDLACCCSCYCARPMVVIGADLVTSPILSSRTLLVLRGLFAAWLVPAAVVLGILKWNEGSIPLGATLSYMSFCLIAIYFTLAVLVTLNNQIIYKQSLDYSYRLLQPTRITMLMRIQWILFQVLVPVALTVSIVYWTILYPHKTKHVTDSGKTVYTHSHTNWGTYHMHACNTVVMMIELFSNRLPISVRDIMFLFLFGAVYIGWALGFHAWQHKWIYYFLDYNRLQAAFYYPGILLGATTLFFVGKLLTALRDKCTGNERRSDNQRTFSHQYHMFSDQEVMSGDDDIDADKPYGMDADGNMYWNSGALPAAVYGSDWSLSLDLEDGFTDSMITPSTSSPNSIINA